MLLFNFGFRHLRRHWRLNASLLLGLTLAAALLASLPTYAATVAARSLKQSLREATAAERNILVVNYSGQSSAGLYGAIQDALGDLIQERVQVRERVVSFESLLVETRNDDGYMHDQAIAPPSSYGANRFMHQVRLWTLDNFAYSVRLVEGAMPQTPRADEQASLIKLPPLEAVIGMQTAAQTGLGVGSRLRVKYDVGLELRIVGIVEPLDPDADMWWSDLSGFGIRLKLTDPTKLDPTEEKITIPVLIPPAAMTRFISVNQAHWRVLVDSDKINANNAQQVKTALVRLQTDMGKTHTQFTTGLVKILEEYRAQVSKTRMAVLLLTAQALIFVLYTLAMLSSFALERSQAELATLSGRGATAWQITLLFAAQRLLLAVLAALLLGPLLAQGALELWSRLSSEAILEQLPPEGHWLALAAAAFGWLSLVLPVYPAARRNLLELQSARARPASQARWQELRLDLFLLVLGGLAYWQLEQAGTFLRDTETADPLLLLGPSLLLLAVALVFLRLFPPLLRRVAGAFQYTRGLLFPLGLARLARDPVKPSRVVILVSLTTGLALFTSSFGDSLSHGQEQMAHYLAGADLRVIREDWQDPGDLPGVGQVSPALRATAQSERGGNVQLLAVDPGTFHRVARYPDGLTNLHMPQVMTVLGQPTDDGTLAAIFSYSAMPARGVLGDVLPFSLGGSKVNLKAIGNISNFPTLEGAFVVVSLPALDALVNLRTANARAEGTQEAWLSVDPAQHAALASSPELGGRILDDAQARLRSLQADALAQGTRGAFQLNTLTLALLSVVGFLLVHYFAAQQRTVEFGVLRSMGLSTRQLLTLLSTEGLLVVALGLLAGTAIGYGLAQTMISFLSRALASSLGGVRISQVLVDWPAVGQLYLVLMAFYLLAIVLLLTALLHVGVHRVLRIGE